jgi:hypothetical protein
MDSGIQKYKPLKIPPVFSLILYGDWGRYFQSPVWVHAKGIQINSLCIVELVLLHIFKHFLSPAL